MLLSELVLYQQMSLAELLRLLGFAPVVLLFFVNIGSGQRRFSHG